MLKEAHFIFSKLKGVVHCTGNGFEKCITNQNNTTKDNS
jgi:hypothetical protein